MNIRITSTEARNRMRDVNKVITDAMSRARTIPSDPLLQTNRKLRQLSLLVTEIDGIKKRHGRLLSQVLIFAINKTPGWEAHRGFLPGAKGKSHLGCLAFESNTGKLYIFDCRRGHGNFDKDTKKAIGERLQSIEANIDSYAEQKFGGQIKSKKAFILSMYGNTWHSSPPVYEGKDISTLFAPCTGNFMNVYMKYIEHKVSNNYSQKISRTNIPNISNVFLRIENNPAMSNSDVIFMAKGTRIV